MAAQAIDFEGAPQWGSRVRRRNTELYAQQLRLRRGPTLEVPFPKHIDNSRLVKAPDPARIREMRVFTVAMSLLLTLAFGWGIERLSIILSSYRVEAEKQTIEQLREENHQLRLSEAQLSQPRRLDEEARKLGLAELQPGQVVRPAAANDPTAPVMAQLNSMPNPAAGPMPGPNPASR